MENILDETSVYYSLFNDVYLNFEEFDTEVIK